MIAQLRALLTVAVLAYFCVPAAAAESSSKKEGDRKHCPSAEEVLKKLDTDHDGHLALNEFLASPRFKDKEKGKEIFAKLDANHDGKLTLDELKTGMAAAHEHAEHARYCGHHRHMKKWPTAEEMFKKIDKNHDGKLTPDEFTVAFDHWRAKMAKHGWRHHGKCHHGRCPCALCHHRRHHHGGCHHARHHHEGCRHEGRHCRDEHRGHHAHHESAGGVCPHAGQCPAVGAEGKK